MPVCGRPNCAYAYCIPHQPTSTCKRIDINETNLSEIYVLHCITLPKWLYIALPPWDRRITVRAVFLYSVGIFFSLFICIIVTAAVMPIFFRILQLSCVCILARIMFIMLGITCGHKRFELMLFNLPVSMPMTLKRKRRFSKKVKENQL